MRGKGIELLDSTVFLQPLLAKEGHIAGPAPDDAGAGRISRSASAWRTRSPTSTSARRSWVKDQAVVAVEAMEGTDETIRRAGRLAGPGACVIKVAKPQQDMRFDVPAVGLPTIAVLQEAGIRLPVHRAGRTLVLDGQAVADAADAARVTVVGRPLGEQARG